MDVIVARAQVSSFNTEQAEQFRSWLSDEEAARNSRYRFQKDRHRDLVARGLVRGMLAQQLKVKPEVLAFDKGEHDKPRLAAPFWRSDCWFNLSHAEDWVVLALAPVPVGIDIEFTQRSNDVLAMADRYFFGREYEQLMAYPPSQREQRFFDYWTLKEAYMKARGEGISLGLSNFGFCLNEGISLHLSESITDDVSQWWFDCSTPYEGYRQAIALRCSNKPDIAYIDIKPNSFFE